MSPNRVNASLSLPALVCPLCKGKLTSDTEAYGCASCDRSYPILHGIPDFRLRSDRYLSLDEERAKAERIEQLAAAGFAAQLNGYYEITADVPPELARRYKAYHHNGPASAAHAIAQLQLNQEQVFLDVGCGSGGALLAAAACSRKLVGVDIALRWLVICKQRLREAGVQASLICADAEALPFPDQCFDQVLASDLLENTYDVNKTLASLERVMTPDAHMWVSGSNKYCLGPHPSTRMWAIGFLPRALRSSLLRRVRGVDSLRFTHLITPLGVRAGCKRLGLLVRGLRTKTLPKPAQEQFQNSERLLLNLYRCLSRIPILSYLLLLVGPSFELHLQKPTKPKS